MKRFITLFVLCCLFFSTSCITSPPDKVLMNLNKIEGFTLKDKPSVYEGEHLYEYITGAAENYHDYGFISVTSGKIALGGETIVVDIYDMGSTTNSFGVFSSSRKPEAEYLNIGTECQYYSPILNLYKGKYLIQLAGAKPAPWLREKLILIARNIDTRINVTKAPPDILNIMPASGRIPHSESYTKKNVMGFYFLKEAWSADYNLKGKQQNLILMRMDSKHEAGEALKQLCTEITNFQKINIPEADEAFTCFDRFSGFILVCRKGNQIIYSASKERQADLKPLVSEQLKNL